MGLLRFTAFTQRVNWNSKKDMSPFFMPDIMQAFFGHIEKNSRPKQLKQKKTQANFPKKTQANNSKTQYFAN